MQVIHYKKMTFQNLCCPVCWKQLQSEIFSLHMCERSLSLLAEEESSPNIDLPSNFHHSMHFLSNCLQSFHLLLHVLVQCFKTKYSNYGLTF